MLLRVLSYTAAAALAMAALPAQAGEPCSVCEDPLFPTKENLAPAIVLEQHVETDVILKKRAELETKDESLADFEEAAHRHQFASVAEVVALAELP